MSDLNSEVDLLKAMPFFERAEDVAATENFDYAIEMYIEGLRRAPDALQKGHAALRHLAILRQGKGGKKPTMIEKVKFRGGKTPLDEMLNAEHLMAKDPDHIPYAETLLKASVAGGYRKTAEWIANLVFEANRASDKPSFSTYILLKDSYRDLELFALAVSACRHATELKPEDGALHDEFRNLSAQMTLQQGKYDGRGDFTKSIKDRDEQDKLHIQNKAVKGLDERFVDVEEAKKAVAKDPRSIDKILRLTDKLFDLGTKKGYDDAVMLLDRAYTKTKDFSFKRKEGELKIKKLKNALRSAKAAVKKGDEQAEKQIAPISEKLQAVELEHYKICVENYPTDLLLKYEYGLCLIKNKLYDEAIPFLQEAQKDPRRRLAAMDETGLCFFLKGWYADAIDIFQTALDACDVKDNSTAKDIRYNLARSYEEDGQIQTSLEMFRKLAQLDFNYKDISQRVANLRKINN